jgi:hypothetical protein
MTPSAIEPATFRFVAQYLNHCATAVPDIFSTLHYLQQDTEVLFIYTVHRDSVIPGPSLQNITYLAQLLNIITQSSI